MAKIMKNIEIISMEVADVLDNQFYLLKSLGMYYIAV
jgi:hypothetical protein